jgi:hypothetical protein
MQVVKIHASALFQEFHQNVESLLDGILALPCGSSQPKSPLQQLVANLSGSPPAGASTSGGHVLTGPDGALVPVIQLGETNRKFLLLYFFFFICFFFLKE